MFHINIVTPNNQMEKSHTSQVSGEQKLKVGYISHFLGTSGSGALVDIVFSHSGLPTTDTGSLQRSRNWANTVSVYVRVPRRAEI